MGTYKTALFKILAGPSTHPEPAATGERENNDREVAAFDRVDEEFFSVLFFSTAGSARTTVKQYEGKTGEGLGSGPGAWTALEARYNAATKEMRQNLNEKLATRKMKPGEDPQDFFCEMDNWKNRLEEMEEKVSDYRYEDIIIHTIWSDYEYVRNKSYSDRTFDLDGIRTTMSNIYIDNLSRSAGNTKSVVGRGVAMQATNGEHSHSQCHNCNEWGHYRNKCPKLKRMERLQQQQPKHWKKGRDSKSKWCPFHKTKSHSDEQCLKQKKMKQQSGGAHFAQKINFSNVSSPAQATEPEKPLFRYSFSVRPSLSTVEGDSTTPAAGKPVILLGPSPSDMLQKQAADTMGLFGAFGGSLHGAANIAITKASGNGISSNSLTMLVDSGATANHLDSNLAPGLKHRIADYKELEQPHKVITAGKHILEGVATGTIKGTVTDTDGDRQHV